MTTSEFLPFLITPYKETEYTELTENGQVVAEEIITKTRSRRYFDLESNEQKIKSDERVHTEFELNKARAKTEILKAKPSPVNESAFGTEADLLESYRRNLNG